MEIIKSIIFGIIEGITEWLPVSSTGHLIIAEEFIKFKTVSPDFWSMFEVVIQLGAIIAVVITFFKELWPFSLKEKNYIKKDTFNMWFKIVVACIPAILIKVLGIDELTDKYFFNAFSVSLALIIVGIIFIVIETLNKKEGKINSIKKITYKTALVIGLFQVIAAIFPGVSRSGATIIGALLIGVDRKTSAEFTFYLAVPVMFGASLLELLDFGLPTMNELIILLTGMVTAFIVSIFIIKFLLQYIKKHDFKVFGYYRIILGIVILLLIYFKAL